MKLKVPVARACPPLGDPVDCSPPGCCVHGILQTRALEWDGTRASCCLTAGPPGKPSSVAEPLEANSHPAFAPGRRILSLGDLDQCLLFPWDSRSCGSALLSTLTRGNSACRNATFHLSGLANFTVLFTVPHCSNLQPSWAANFRVAQGSLLTVHPNIFLFLLAVVQSLIMSDSLQSRGLQHVRLPCPSPAPRLCSNACPWSW